ncbi:hypothetical protein C8R46DRAFT_1056857 [Mycena filopes]|nr:hypothetical protein C8R46DRAFT_1056857 [Mycena filopes]
MFQALEHPLEATPACPGITTISSLHFARGRRHDFLGRNRTQQSPRRGQSLVRVGLTCLHSFREAVAPRKPGATTQHAAVGDFPPGCLGSWCVLSCAYFSRLTNLSCIRIVRTCVGCLCRLCTRYHTFDRHPLQGFVKFAIAPSIWVGGGPGGAGLLQYTAPCSRVG